MTIIQVPSPLAGGMTLIQEVVANANSSISFSSIPATYKQLLLIWSGIKHSASGATFHLRINANSGNYFSNSHTQRNNETGIASNNSIGFIGSYSYGTNVAAFGVNVNDASNINNSSFGRVLIDNYTSTTKGKSFEHNFGFNSYETGQVYHVNGNGFWNNTDVVTSLDIVRTAGTATASNFTNTSIRLYGVS